MIESKKSKNGNGSENGSESVVTENVVTENAKVYRSGFENDSRYQNNFVILTSHDSQYHLAHSLVICVEDQDDREVLCDLESETDSLNVSKVGRYLLGEVHVFRILLFLHGKNLCSANRHRVEEEGPCYANANMMGFFLYRARFSLVWNASEIE